MVLLEGKILNGKYRVEKELGRGGMSCVYLCTNVELGNQWAVKHIFKQNSNAQILLAEEEILKKLNHINLPRIIDVFYDESGTYIVESYIEGTPLNIMLQQEGNFNEDTVLGWAKELCDVLIYLHSMEPHPIIYRDMKPSNIIITRNNKAVIVDFGISREHKGENAKDTFVAGTCSYASPEQLTGYGCTDQRTDIYSLGVTLYHLLTGRIPEYNAADIRIYKTNISQEMNYIVQRCIQKNLEDRYQSVEELRADLDNIRDSKVRRSRAALTNKLIVAGIIVMSLISYAMALFGLIQVNRDKTIVLEINPKLLFLSEQQSGQILIEKVLGDGRKEELDGKKIIWSSSNESVAKAADGKVIAMNAGKAQLYGKFGNKVVQLYVNVCKMQNDYINVSLKYNKSYCIEKFAGNGERDSKDGGIKEAGFSEPTSLTGTSDGTIYVIDGYLRKVKAGKVETVNFEPDYVEPKLVRSNRRSEVFIASREWIANDEQCRIGVFGLENNKLKAVFKDDGELYTFEDFAFDSLNNIYILESNLADGSGRLVEVNTLRKSAKVLKEGLDGISSITIDQKDEVFMSSGKYGTIYKWDKSRKDIGFIAGIYNQKHFVDGKDNRFFEPNRIYACSDSIYVMDYGVIRKMNLLEGRVEDVETIAGQVTTQTQGSMEGIGVDVNFTTKPEKELFIDEKGNIYITDTGNNIIRRIYLKEAEVPVGHNV